MASRQITAAAFVAIPLFILIGACTQGTADDPEERNLDGVWRTEGYGHLIEIVEGEARIWERSAISCLLDLEMRVEASQDSEAEATLVLGSGQMRIDLESGSSPNEKWLAAEGTASRRRMVRVDSLPENCAEEHAEDPAFVFEVFWQAFDEHYPFFEMKGIDWQAARDLERPRISDQTTDQELFDILKGMIEPLEDAHTFLSAPDLDLSFGGRRADPHRLDDAARARAQAVVDENYLVSPPNSLCNDQIVVGRLEDELRYLRLHSFSGYGNDFRDGLQCLRTALDELLVESSSIRGLVIDVRINGGGADPYGLAIASRLTDTDYLAYTKETRNDPKDPSSWTEGQPAAVQPSQESRHTGPVVLLTGRNSVSAAETFTMALMGRSPKVTRIGERTQGVFSDVLGRSLPNGWSFGLPNERFLTEDGRSFDGPGIAPDIETPVFPAADLEAGRDSALELALEILNG